MGQQTVGGAWLNEGTADALAAMIAGDPFSGAKLHLYKSSLNPGRSNVEADFVAAEADFTGYAAQTLTYSALGIDANGDPTILSDRVFFQATDGAVPNTIGGCWISHDTTGPPATHTALEFYEFAAPVSVLTALAFVGVVVALQAPAKGGYAIVDS